MPILTILFSIFDICLTGISTVFSKLQQKLTWVIYFGNHWTIITGVTEPLFPDVLAVANTYKQLLKHGNWLIGMGIFHTRPHTALQPGEI